MAKTKSAGRSRTQSRLQANLRHLITLAKYQGQTQHTIARAAGIHPSYLSLILRGKRRITLDLIEAVAAPLGTTAETLVQADLTNASPNRETIHAPSDPDPRLTTLQAVARALFPSTPHADALAFAILARSLPEPEPRPHLAAVARRRRHAAPAAVAQSRPA